MNEQNPQFDYRGLEPVVIRTVIPAKGKRDKGTIVIARIIGDPLGIVEGHTTIGQRDDTQPAQNPPVPPGRKRRSR